MKFLNKRQILMLHTALIAEFGGSDGIRDEGLLESAINAPFQHSMEQSFIPLFLRKLFAWIRINTKSSIF